MHNNYHFLRSLHLAIAPRFTGAFIRSCYSQDKDELILGLEKDGEPLFIRAHFTPAFSSLSFPDSHARARKNSIDLFPEIIGRSVGEVRLHSHERAISLLLSGEFALTFKLFGNRSNVLLFQDSVIFKVFRSSLKQDLEFDWFSLDSTPDFSFEAFTRYEGDPVKFCKTLGRPVRGYLRDQGFETLPMRERYDYLVNFIDQLSLPPFYIVEKDEKIRLLLYPDGDVLTEEEDAIVALNKFYITHQREGQLRKERKLAVDRIGRELERALRYVDKNRKKLKELDARGSYQQTADLVMANLHRFQGGITEIEAEDFYNNNAPVVLKIKPSITPQKFAEQLYRKAKNQHLEISNLESNIKTRTKEIAVLSNTLEEIKKCEDVRSLRKLVGEPKGVRSVQPDISQPYRLVELEGYQIWIGKSGKANDAMLRLCHKDDLWLHAKDTPGSHVIIRRKSGTGIPGSVKERAAELAAYYSKRKQDTLCPVIITPRKYVRKRKGDPAGLVRVDREEEVLLVSPRS